jgi:hypothetical protein
MCDPTIPLVRSAPSPEYVRCRIPKVASQADRFEDTPHFVRSRTTGLPLQACAVPSDSKLPQLVHADNRSRAHLPGATPCINEFLRPEEEHIASRKDQIVPPLGRGHEAMEKPGGRFRSAQSDVELEWVEALLTPGPNQPRPMERCRDSQCVPGTIGILLDLPHIQMRYFKVTSRMSLLPMISRISIRLIAP